MGWKVTNDGLVIDGPIVSVLTTLIAAPLAGLGVIMVSVVFTASELLPDPPGFISDTELVSELANEAAPLFSDPVATAGDIGFFVAGAIFLLGGGLLLVKALTDSEFALTFESS